MAYSGRVIRIVEGQNRISTNRLAGALEEQALLEALVEEVKPALPPSAHGLHFLLATPFRYGHRKDSRFRRAGERPGIFYASERIETAVAEAAYWRMLFFSRSPGALLPTTTTEYTSFSVRVEAQAIDLTHPPFDRSEAQWTADDYEPCQRLAARARAIDAGAIRYKSSRDPGGGANIALLDPGAFREKVPRIDESWHFRFVDGRLSALASFPSRLGFSFDFAKFDLQPP
jgi:hypothetical protein